MSLSGGSRMTIGVCVPSTVCVFDFAIDCLWHSVQRSEGEDKCSNCTFHSTWNDDEEWSAAGAGTKAHKPHYPNQSVWHPLLGIIGEREKKSEEKINRPVATLKELLLRRFHMCATLLKHKGGKKQEGIQRRRLESQGKACLATTSHNKRLVQCFSASFTCVIACFSNCWKYDSKIEMSLSPLNWAWIGGVKLAITVRGPLKAKRPLVDVLSEAMSYLLRVFSTPVPEQWAQEEHFRAAQFKMQSACRYRMLEKYLNNFKYICFLYRLQ